jgi:hypothetical protein
MLDKNISTFSERASVSETEIVVAADCVAVSQII